jgi:hypothetical protein
MEKAKSLRAAIEAALPEFTREPARLRVWIEDGTARCHQTGTLGFAFSYRLNILLVEFGHDEALVALAIFRWLRVNQPDLLAPGAEGFTFDTEVLDNKTSDVLIQLQLHENVAVTEREEGGWRLDYLAEPDPLYTDGEPLAGLAEIPPLADVIIDG